MGSYVILLSGGIVGDNRSSFYSGVHQEYDDYDEKVHNTFEYTSDINKAKRFDTAIEAHMFAREKLGGGWNNVIPTVMGIVDENDNQLLARNTANKIASTLQKCLDDCVDMNNVKDTIRTLLTEGEYE